MALVLRGMKLEIINDQIHDSILSADFSKIKQFLSKIEEIEEKFLEIYQKRKKEGVFFTNDKIAHFMVERSLLIIINKYLKNQHSFQKDIKNIKDVYFLNQEDKARLYNFLINLTVCDPACGSGVFLINFSNILWTILKDLKIERNSNLIKQKIISNLYGLDINEIPLNLCKLKILKWYSNTGDVQDEKIISFVNKNYRINNSIFSNNWKKQLFNLNYYDLIIGNPPYGNILSWTEKEILKSQNIFFKDIYCTFLSKALNWIEDGIITFLVPKSFLIRQGYVNFRNHLLNKSNLLEIHDLGSSIFPKATNEVLVLIYEKDRNARTELKIFDYPDKFIISHPKNGLDSLNICYNKKCKSNSPGKKFYFYTFKSKCPYCNSKTTPMNRIRLRVTSLNLSILQKIETMGNLNYLNMSDFPKLKRGEEHIGLKEVKKYIKRNKSNSCYFIDAKQDFKYYFLNYNKSFNLHSVDSKLLKGKNFEYYIKPKLLIKHNNIIPEAIYTEDQVCFTSSIYSLLHEDIDELKYLSALLNSSLIQFYCLIGINNQKDTTINLNQYMIRHLPIITPKKPVMNQILSNADEIVKIFRKTNGRINDDIIKDIRLIDGFIFTLYSISNEEKEQIISEISNNIEYFKTIY